MPVPSRPPKYLYLLAADPLPLSGGGDGELAPLGAELVDQRQDGRLVGVALFLSEALSEAEVADRTGVYLEGGREDCQ